MHSDFWHERCRLVWTQINRASRQYLQSVRMRIGDNGCFLDDHEVLKQARVWAEIGAEQANDQTSGKFSHGRWWMTYGLLGETGNTEFSRAGL